MKGENEVEESTGCVSVRDRKRRRRGEGGCFMPAHIHTLYSVQQVERLWALAVTEKVGVCREERDWEMQRERGGIPH